MQEVQESLGVAAAPVALCTGRVLPGVVRGSMIYEQFKGRGIVCTQKKRGSSVGLFRIVGALFGPFGQPLGKHSHCPALWQGGGAMTGSLRPGSKRRVEENISMSQDKQWGPKSYNALRIP